MNKRILSILLCLMLVVALLVMAVPVNAASDSATVSITADKTNAKPGDEITFTVVLGPVEKLCSFDFKIDVPDGLTLGTVTTDSGARAALSSNVIAVDLVDNGGQVQGAMFASGNFDVASDVTLGTFTCTVADDATGTKSFSLAADWPSVITDEIDTGKDINFVSDDITIGAEPTDAPAEPTDAPAEPTDAPAEPTDAPAEPTDAPAEPTEAPHVHNLEHKDEVPATTEAEGLKEHYYCADCGKYFADATGTTEVTYESLIIPKLTPEPTDAPVEPTDAPVEPTDAPVEPTDAPVEPTDAPVEPTDAPVEPTDAPVEPTDAPVEPTDAPVVEPTDAPAEPTDAPVVEPTKAPATKDQVKPTTVATKDVATKTAASAKTGDSTHMYLWMLIMLASMAGVAAVLYTAKRKGIFTK